ncbi:MAG: BatA domain-containing protein, partial [Candidatus Neomarinimicrobiota bacterium]
MSFLNPGFLWLLPLIGVPLLIHLLGRQRFQVVEFSTLRFLKSLQNDVLRRLKIRQIILLILRTLLVLCLILIFARPYRSGRTPGIFVGKGTNLYLIIDNSASLSLNVQGRPQLTNAMEMIETAADKIDFPVNLNLILSTRPDRIEHRTIVSGKAELVQELAGIKTTEYGGRLIPALRTAVGDISANHDANGVIWLASDFQRSNWSAGTQTVKNLWENIHANKIRLVLFPVAAPAENTALGELIFTEQIQAKDKSVTLKILAENWRTNAQECPVSLFIENERVGQALINLPPGKRSEATFEFVPLATGALSGYLQTDDDDLTADNRRFFVLNIPAVIRILVVGEQPTDGNYIVKALDASPAQTITSRFVTADYFGNENLAQYDGLIFSNVSRLSGANQSALADYLSNGGGVLLFVDRNCTPEDFNALWADRFGVPHWHGTRRGSDATYLSVGRFKTDHPIFRELWPKDEIPAGSPRFFNVPGFVCGAQHTVLMSFDDGTPLLIETKQATGRCVLMATVPHGEWTDLPFSGFFPAVLNRLVLYISGGAQQPVNYATGDTLSLN